MAESLTKGGFTLTPKTGTGNAKVSISCSERTGRVATSPVTFTAKMDGFSVSKSVSVVQEGKAEFVHLGKTAYAVNKEGEVVTVEGISNSPKLTFSFLDSEIETNNYTANGAAAVSGEAIAGDPGASAQYTFSIPVTIPVNPSDVILEYTMTVKTESGETVEVLFTQAASVFTYKLIPKASMTTIPASGGSSTITAILEEYRNGIKIKEFERWPTECTIPEGTAFTVKKSTSEPIAVSAPNRGTTAGDKRSVTVTVRYEDQYGRYDVSSDTVIYQAANQVESSTTTGGETIYNPVTAGAISNKTIPASGGSATATAGDGSQSWTTNKKYRHDTYTSGSVDDVLIEDSKIGTDTIKPSVASISGSAESKGTIKSDITTVKEQAVTWTGNGGKKATGTMYIYQAANAEDYIEYSDPVIQSFTVDDISASGGSISSGSVTYEQTRRQYFTSGAYTTLTPLTSGGTVTYSTAVSADSLGTTIKDRASVGTLTATVTMNGKSVSKDVTVYQAINKVVAIKAHQSGDISSNIHVEYPTEFISAAGGTIDPIVEGQLTVTCSSGSTITTGNNGDFLTGTVEFTRTFSGTAAGFTVNETSGVVEASSRGTTIGDERSVDVTSELTATFTNPASVGGNNITDTISCVNTVTQAANSVTYGAVSVSVTPNPVSILAAGAVYNIKPTTSQNVGFSSGDSRPGNISLSYVAKNTVTGFSNNEETVTVQPNTTTSPRKGFIVTVTATGEGSRSDSVDVTFNQAAAAAYLNVNPATISIAADATSASFNIESNDSWTIS